MKENASADELTKAKDKAKSEGGEIKHEFTLIKGFTFVFSPIDTLGIVLTAFSASSSLMTKSESFRRTSISMSSRMARSKPNDGWLGKRREAGVIINDECLKRGDETGSCTELHSTIQ